MSAVAAHLWSSTLVLLAVLIAARILPLTARTRYALLFCGLVKFAVPSAAITEPLRAIGIDLANLGPRSNGTMSMQWLGGPASLGTLSSNPASGWPQALTMVWILSAVAFGIAWAIARSRLVSAALAAASPASQREHTALAAARRSLGLRASVDITRSPICEAPAVVRIIRPVVVLPDGGCDALDKDELESLLRHECAHVARRDNLFGLIESAIVAAFWFHPLVWVAQRSIATAREESCDETAAATTDAINTYVSALSKICRAVLAPRLAGVSCMASAHLKERLNHLMNYELLRNRAWSHRIVVAFATIAILAVTVGTGLHATPSPDSKVTPFTLKFSVRPGDLSDRLELRGRVIDNATGLALLEPRITFKRGSSASIHAVAEDRDVQIEIRDAGEKVSVVMRISEKGVPLQESTYFAVPLADGPRNASGRRYTGTPISLDLKDADIKQVIDTFAKLTNTDIQYPATLEGKVTIKITEMPWDEAFDLVLQQRDLSYELKGDSILIKP